MGFIKIAVSLFVLLFLVKGIFATRDNSDPNPSREVFVYEVINSFAQKAQKKHRVEISGKGKNTLYDVQKIEVSFYANQSPSQKEARMLEVLLSEELVKEINSYKQIHPFLRLYPADASLTDVWITFLKPEALDAVHWITHTKGEILYWNKDNEVITSESYQEALEKVRQDYPELGL